MKGRYGKVDRGLNGDEDASLLIMRPDSFSSAKFHCNNKQLPIMLVNSQGRGIGVK